MSRPSQRRRLDLSFESIGSNTSIYLLSTFLQLPEVLKFTEISKYFNRIIHSNMNVIVMTILRHNHQQPSKENIVLLQRRCPKGLFPVYPVYNRTFVGRCFGTYPNYIKNKARNWTLSIITAVDHKGSEPTNVWINNWVRNAIKDYYNGSHFSYLFKVQTVQISLHSKAVNISAPSEGKINVHEVNKKIMHRLTLNLPDGMCTIENRRVVLVGNKTLNETGILYEFPTSSIFHSEFQNVLSQVHKVHNLSILNCHSVVSNFIIGADYEVLKVHNTEFERRDYPNRYETELFQMCGPMFVKDKVGVRNKRQSINWLNKRFYLHMWCEVFPWQQMHIAGSSILGALDSSLDESIYPIGDLDFFNVTPISNRTWRKLVRDFMSTLVSLANRVRLVVSSRDVLHRVTRMKWRVRWNNDTPDTCFDFVYVHVPLVYPIYAFDISLSQSSFDGTDFYCSPAFKQALITNTFTSANFGGSGSDLQLQLSRPYKYVSRGYNFIVSKDINETDMREIEAILENAYQQRLRRPRNTLPPYSGLVRSTLDIYKIHDKFINLL